MYRHKGSSTSTNSFKRLYQSQAGWRRNWICHEVAQIFPGIFLATTHCHLLQTVVEVASSKMKIDVGFVWTFAVLASAAVVQVPVVIGQELCAASQGVCGGVSARMLSGACTDLFFVCEDGDAGTVSSCLTATSSCSHQVPAGSDEPKCFTECAPDCENKACGEDGCGGFCGACATGQGCSNYECVVGQSDGSCDAPLNLGNTNTTTAPVIETDDRVTIMTVGDTTQALHFETPSCNTLTASPELVFSFVVPDGKTYGYDMQLSGYDTVIQLMKVRTVL
jgi:hypothetical protein